MQNNEKTRYYEAMTLIAGFKLQDGVTIYSDRQFTTERIKFNEDKFLVYTTDAVKAVVAMAGDHLSVLMNAQGFFRELTLRQTGNSTVTIEEARKLLRTVLVDYYREEHFPLSLPDHTRDSPFGIVLAIWTKQDGVTRLFAVNRSDVAEIQSYEFRGSGADVGRILAAPLYEAQQTVSRSSALFISALLKAQEHDVATGGGLDVTTLYNDGRVKHRRLSRPDLTTKALTDYGNEVASLERTLADPLVSEADFGAKLEDFVATAKELRLKILPKQQAKKG